MKLLVIAVAAISLFGLTGYSCEQTPPAPTPVVQCDANDGQASCEATDNCTWDADNDVCAAK